MIVVHKSSQLVACCGKATRILNSLKLSKQLAVLKWAGHGRSKTLTDLVAYHTELVHVVMSQDVVRSRRLVKHGELPTSCYDIEGNFSGVPTTSHEFTTTFL